MIGMSGLKAVILSLIVCWLVGHSLTLQPNIICNATIGQQIRRYVQMEQDLMKIFTNSVELKRSTLHQLSKQHEELARIVGEVTNRSHYLGSLLNSFSMISRLTKSWPVVVSLASITGEPARAFGLSAMVAEAWESAVKCLVRLQSVYNISTAALVSGQIEGTYSHANLTASDCFDIGSHYFQQSKHERAAEWLQAAFQRAEEDSSISSLQVLEHLHLAQCFKGDQNGSSATLQMVLKDSPSFKPSEKLLTHHAQAVSLGCHVITKNVTTNINGKIKGSGLIEDDHPAYQMCRPDLYQHPSDKQLRCRLLHYNRSDLRIRPLKMEEFHIDPPLLMFHQAISDKEIEYLTKTFYNKMGPATQDYDGYDKITNQQYNIWIDHEAPSDAISQRINLRNAQYTNMNLDYSEPNMLANYGLGGELVIHKDSGDYQETTDEVRHETLEKYVWSPWADYVSLLYYLNDVEEGGFTIYPNINVAVRPVKGSALLWFNRLPDLTPSEEVMHSGCPVLRGTKWILNKWLHVFPQDFPKCVMGKEKSYKYYYL